MFTRSKSKDRDKTLAETLADDLNIDKLTRRSFHNSTANLHDTEEIEHPFKVEQSNSAKPDEYDEFLIRLKQDPGTCKLLDTSLGRILLSQTAYIVELARKNKVPLEKNYFDETVNNYTKFLEENQVEKEHTSININESIKQALRENLIQQHNEVFDQETKTFLLPPFPENNTSSFFSDQKLNIVNNTFPVRQKFSGKDNPSITEFLRNIKNAQLQCQLNETQFTSVFLRCFTGQPYETVSDALNGHLSINEIISSLLIKYDKRIKPDEASALLHNYKLPHNATYDSIVSDIIHLAQRACADQPETIKNDMYNHTAIETLLKNLPPDNKADGEKTRMQLVSLYGRQPTFDEFSRSLRKIATAIDLNYKKLRHFSNKHSLQTIKPSSHVKSIRPTTNFIRSGHKVLQGSSFRNINIKEVNTRNKNQYTSNNNYMQRNNYENKQRQYNTNYRNNANPQNNKYNQNRNPNFINVKPSNNRDRTQNYYKPNYNKSYNSNYKNSKNNNNSNYNNSKNNNYNKYNKRKLHCLLCGKSGHTATDFCFEMRTDAGNFALVNRVPDPCPQCLADTQDKLFHPDDFCPRRPRALFLKSNNQWPPPTDEIKEQMRKQLATFHR